MLGAMRNLFWWRTLVFRDTGWPMRTTTGALATEALLEDVQYREECGEKVGLGFKLPMPKPVLFGLRGLQNEENVVAASRHVTPICRGKWRSLGEDIGTTDLLAHNQDVVGTFLWCKLLVQREVVGANGFEPSTSWSRTSLDQTKSVELTGFACAFPPLIWATWATKYRWPQFGMFTLADRPVDLPCLFANNWFREGNTSCRETDENGRLDLSNHFGQPDPSVRLKLLGQLETGFPV